MNRLHTSIFAALLASGALLLCSACTIREGTIDGYAYVRTDGPTTYERYPHTRYRDRDVYWIEGRWYWRGETGWYAFDDEPRDLHRWRDEGYGGYYTHTNPGPHPQKAPPAYAPPQPYGSPGVQHAPPAY